MKAVIIGGGKGCRSLLELTRGKSLKEFKIDVVGVVDINTNAPGAAYARELGLRTFKNFSDLLSELEFELIIELTGDENVLHELYKELKSGIKIIDHEVARIFWDVLSAQENQQWQYNKLEKLEKTLEGEKYFLQSIFNSSSDLSIVMDVEKNILRANNKFIEFTGKTHSEIIGKKCFDALKGTKLDCGNYEYCEMFYTAVFSGTTQTSIRRTPPPNESHWEVTRTPIKNWEGEIDAILATWHRITDKVMLMREIESAETKFNSFINSAQDWISIKDKNGNYVIVNKAIAGTFGFKPEEFIGKKASDMLPPKMASTITKHDAEVLENKIAKHYDEIIPIEGKDHHFHTIRFPLFDYNGELNGVCTIARDTSKEVLLQEQLVQSEKLAALGKLAAGVAHEINNPLTGIMAYTEDLIEEISSEDPHNEDLKIILRETLRCRDIVRNLLDFARQDNPKFEIVEPNKIIEGTLNLLVKLPQFKDIIIQQNLDRDIPLIQSDPNQIQQVILNLLLNSADAMKYKGKIIIKSEYDLKNDKCTFSVEDSGPGIPENLIDKIFEPFFSTKGTNGLGLAVSWGIIERHHGTIEVDTAESGGAVFKVVIPVFRR
ncbi:MAG: PAS domain-containing protein [Ignavibacteriae bacterium]|nr:PAS domain-containing protein [Ignavibacteriota bacterium]